MGQEWRDPGGVAAASRFRAVADVFAGGTGKRDSQIVVAAMDAAKPKIEAAARGKVRSSHESGLASECIGSEAGMWHRTSFSLQCTKLT